MKLRLATQVNKYFEKGSRPTKKQWADSIERGEIAGKVAMGKVWVDIDDFLSKDIFSDTPANDNEVDLLDG